MNSDDESLPDLMGDLEINHVDFDEKGPFPIVLHITDAKERKRLHRLAIELGLYHLSYNDPEKPATEESLQFWCDDCEAWRKDKVETTTSYCCTDEYGGQGCSSYSIFCTVCKPREDEYYGNMVWNDSAWEDDDFKRRNSKRANTIMISNKKEDFDDVIKTYFKSRPKAIFNNMEKRKKNRAHSFHMTIRQIRQPNQYIGLCRALLIDGKDYNTIDIEKEELAEIGLVWETSRWIRLSLPEKPASDLKVDDCVFWECAGTKWKITKVIAS